MCEPVRNPRPLGQGRFNPNAVRKYDAFSSNLYRRQDNRFPPGYRLLTQASHRIAMACRRTRAEHRASVRSFVKTRVRLSTGAKSDGSWTNLCGQKTTR